MERKGPNLLLERTSKTTLIFNVLAIIILVNFIVGFFPLKLDLTANREFSLSQASKKILNSLDDLVTVKVFLSENLPVRLLPVKQRVRDLLTEYEKNARGKLRVIYIDPKNDPELINQALSFGIPQLRFSDVQNDKFSVSNGFLGIAVTFGDKKAVIEAVTDESNLEHEISATLRRVSAKTTPTIAITSGHGETDPARLSLLRELLEKDFTVTEIEIGEKNDPDLIREGIKTLLIIGPTETYGNRALFVLDQFLMQGGSLVLLTDGVSVSGSLQPSITQTGLNGLTENFGLKVENNLVLSADNEVANFSTGLTTFVTPYPFWVRVTKPGFNHSFPATANLELAVFPWVSSLNLNPNHTGNSQLTDLVKTSPRSYSQNGSINLDPGRADGPKKEDLKEFTVVALFSGQAESLFKNRGDLTKIVKKDEKPALTSTATTQLAIFADSDFVNDYFLRRYGGNAALLLNVVEAVSSDTSLSEIRAKTSTFRPLRDLGESYQALIKWSNILIVPLLTITLGTARFLLRGR